MTIHRERHLNVPFHGGTASHGKERFFVSAAAISRGKADAFPLAPPTVRHGLLAFIR